MTLPSHAARAKPTPEPRTPLHIGWRVKGWDNERILFEDVDEREHWVLRAALHPVSGPEPEGEK